MFCVFFVMELTGVLSTKQVVGLCIWRDQEVDSRRSEKKRRNALRFGMGLMRDT